MSGASFQLSSGSGKYRLSSRCTTMDPIRYYSYVDTTTTKVDVSFGEQHTIFLAVHFGL